jgi:hypothetical protein
MEATVFKLMSYFALLGIVIYAVYSSLGKRSQVLHPRAASGMPFAAGSVNARKSVPAASSQWMAAGVFPTPPVGLGNR